MQKKPPCSSCEYAHGPDLLPENEGAFEIWMAVRTQWRVDGVGKIGLDYSEVRYWADYYDTELSPGIWSKIKSLELFEIERTRSNAD